MNNDETKQALQFLNSAWTHAQMPPETARVFGVELNPYPHAAVMAALRGLARTSKWRPSLAEILALLEPDTKEQASAAFASLRMAFLAPPGEKDAAVSPATAEAVRRLGGWGIVGQWKRENYGIHQREFERVYSEGVSRENNLRAVGASPGLKGLLGGGRG